MERSEQRNELSIEDLVGQLGDTTEYNALKEKVSQIEKSKVDNSVLLSVHRQRSPLHFQELSEND